MLDCRTQLQFLDAATAMLLSGVGAATGALAASAAQGFTLWSDLLRAAGRPFPAPAWPLRHAADPPGPWPSPASWLAVRTAWPQWPGDLAGFVDMPWTPFTRAWWPGAGLTVWMPLADWTPWGLASLEAWSSWLDQAPLAPSARGANGWGAAHPDRGFASYRSAGGHASAQAAVPGAELAELGAAAVLAPMRAFLGAWRAALEG
jgi:hypothetical protein